MQMKTVIGLLALAWLALPAHAAYIEAAKVINIQDDYSILPVEVYVGDTVSLSVQLHNKGMVNMAKDLKAELVLPAEFEGLDVESSLDNIRPNITQTVLFKFRIREDALPGVYSLNIRINYKSMNVVAENVEKEVVEDIKTITIPVNKARKNLELKVEPVVLLPGRKVDVKFTLSNTSNNVLSNINLSWTEANSLILPIGSDNRRYIASLGAGKQAEVTFLVAVDPNITPGVNAFDTNITYNDESASTNTLTSKIGFVVGGTTDFDVSLQETGNNQVSLSIANIGSNNAEGIVVRIPEQAHFSTQGFDTAVLGNLNRGDFTIASFRIEPTSGTAEARRQARQGGFLQTNALPPAGESKFADLQVEITYTDTTGERQTVKKTVHFLPQSLWQPSTEGGQAMGQARQGGFPWLPALVVLVGVGGAYYLYLKKRKRAGK